MESRKPSRHQHRGARALALDDGVGGERRAVNDEANVRWLEVCLREDLLDADQHAFLGRARRGQHLQLWRCSPASMAKSVKVPPMSMARRACVMRYAAVS